MQNISEKDNREYRGAITGKILNLFIINNTYLLLFSLIIVEIAASPFRMDNCASH